MSANHTNIILVTGGNDVELLGAGANFIINDAYSLNHRGLIVAGESWDPMVSVAERVVQQSPVGDDGPVFLRTRRSIDWGIRGKTLVMHGNDALPRMCGTQATAVWWHEPTNNDLSLDRRKELLNELCLAAFCHRHLRPGSEPRLLITARNIAGPFMEYVASLDGCTVLSLDHGTLEYRLKTKDLADALVADHSWPD